MKQHAFSCFAFFLALGPGCGMVVWTPPGSGHRRALPRDAEPFPIPVPNAGDESLIQKCMGTCLKTDFIVRHVSDP